MAANGDSRRCGRFSRLGPREGEMQGMSGGVLVLRGSAGLRSGDRLRRGTIVIEGDTGDCPGSRMIAGTLVILGRCGAHPGYLMKRGTIALAKPPVLGATFTDSGLFASSFPGVFAKLLEPESKGAGSIKAKMRRFSGDMAASARARSRPGIGARSLDFEHDFTDVAARLDIGMRLARSRERKGRSTCGRTQPSATPCSKLMPQ